MIKHALLQILFLLHCGNALAAAAEPWTLPVSAAAAQPNLSKTVSGTLLLSWIERNAVSGHRLQMAEFKRGRWSTPHTIAEGANWFVNWADFPSTTVLPNGTFWAHYLVKRGAGTYAYDVVLKRSTDGGKTWSTPITAHDDGTQSEHGFVSLWPWSANELAVAWLDGRQTAGAAGHDHSKHPDAGGLETAMTLRTAVFGSNGKKSREWQLDGNTCDCCQTDAALTDKGPMVIYRDRDTAEIRDIYVTRHTGKAWSTGKPVARDNWTMPACPVNGPAIAAQGSDVWAAWYTAADNRPAVRLALSSTSGDRFQTVKTIRQGEQIQGRVDVSADSEGAWLLWTEESAAQTLWLQRFDRRMTAVGKALKVAQLKSRGRATGFARMQQTRDGLYVVWTDAINGKPQLQGAVIR
jgi:predicted hotdog family 3-hydroxylacyl-ACP dehydratase